jgi:hypothetical protein
MPLPAGNASSILGITNAAPTTRVPLSSSTTMTDDEALTPRLTVIGAVNRAAEAEPGDQERTWYGSH